MNDETFVGPVVQIFMKPPANGGMYQNVYLRQLAGRDFLVGTLAPFDTADQRSGNETWCSLDHVQMLIHFPDIEAARQYWADHLKRRADREHIQQPR
jgi:hypothetical protein